MKKRRNELKPGMDVDALEAALARFREGLSDEELDDLITSINGEQIAERSADNDGADSATLDKGKPSPDPKFPYGA